MRPPSIPRWQTRLLQVSLAAIVLAVLAALVIAPSVLRRNMETVDTSAYLSPLMRCFAPPRSDLSSSSSS